jgi:hypothetical protein
MNGAPNQTRHSFWFMVGLTLLAPSTFSLRSSLLLDTASLLGTIAVMATANTPLSTDGTQTFVTRSQ